MRKLPLLLLLAVSACGDFSHSQSNELLTGQYLFRSQGFNNGTPFSEAGTITYDPAGPRYQIDSTYNEGGAAREVHVSGTYELHGNVGHGTSPGDHATFYVSPDRSLIYAVGTDTHGTWLAELHQITH